MTPRELTLARERLKLNKVQLAAVAGVNERSIRRWESGHFRASEMLARLLFLLERIPGAMELLRREFVERKEDEAA